MKNRNHEIKKETNERDVEIYSVKDITKLQSTYFIYSSQKLNDYIVGTKAKTSIEARNRNFRESQRDEHLATKDIVTKIKD